MSPGGPGRSGKNGGAGSVLPRLLVRLASFLVPRYRRREWAEEWYGELASLEVLRDGGRRDPKSHRKRGGVPAPLTFAFGALPHAVWTLREEWTMDSVIQDLRFAGRVFRRAPGFTLAGALTLALGIGATGSIFSLVNALLFEPPAGISEPDQIVQIARSYEDAPRWDNFSWPAMELIEREGSVFSGVAGYQAQPVIVGRGRDTERVLGEYATADYFQVLGVRPFLGRLLQPSDGLRPGGHAVAVLAHSFWERRFGADPQVVGRVLHIGDRPYEIVGVAPESFRGVETIGSPPSLWIPALQHPGWFGSLPFDDWGASWVYTVGRLRAGVSLEEAQAAMRVVSTRLREADPVNEGMLVLLAQGVGLDPEGRQEARQLSWILLLVVGVVLLLTCTNVANLALTRAAARTNELGIRQALGAQRPRLLRQMVTESVFLGLVAAGLAVPLVLAAESMVPLVFPYTLNVPVGADAKVFGFLGATGVLAGLAFGLAPAWTSSRGAVLACLREGGASQGRFGIRLGNALVVGQLALSLGLVSGAALLGRSVLNASRAEPGFSPDGLSVAFLDLEATGRYDTETGRDFLFRLQEAVEEIPGIQRVALASQAPLVGGHSRRTVFPVGVEDLAVEAEFSVVGPGYFETAGIDVLSGRTFRDPEDEPERVVVVNRALAQLYWPGEDALGKELDGDPRWRVIGVVEDVQMRSLRARPNPGAYFPLSHEYSGRVAVHLLTGPDGDPPVAALREAVAAMDPQLPLHSVVDLRSWLVQSMGETRTVGLLLAMFAGLSLVLAAVGLYGVVALGAARRVKEMGIRLALGADPRSLTRLVLIRAVSLSLVGIAAGIGVAYAMGKALGGLLFRVSATHVPTLTTAGLLLLVTALFAAWLPAYRASRTDATASLREE